MMKRLMDGSEGSTGDDLEHRRGGGHAGDQECEHLPIVHPDGDRGKPSDAP